MRIAFLVNRANALEPRQTTTALIAAARHAGHEVWVLGVADIQLGEGTPGPSVHALARAVPDTSPALLGRELGPPEPVLLDTFDAVLVRTNPGRDKRRWAHGFASEALEMLGERGIPIINRPEGIRRLGGKPGCMLLPPEIRPKTLITRDSRAIMDFLGGEGRCVVKPASGTHGRGVFVLRADDPNIRTAVELLAGSGMVVVQEWLPEAVDGDVRLFVVDGRLFEVGGHVAAVRRRPARGELRSNVHLGGTPEPVEMVPDLERAAELAGPVLTRLGVRVAGLDCIGGRVVEINACAPGGLGDCNAFYGVDFASALLERLL